MMGRTLLLFLFAAAIVDDTRGQDAPAIAYNTQMKDVNGNSIFSFSEAASEFTFQFIISNAASVTISNTIRIEVRILSSSTAVNQGSSASDFMLQEMFNVDLTDGSNILPPQNITIQIIDDNIVERDETIILRVQDVSDIRGRIHIANTEVPLTIVDDDRIIVAFTMLRIEVLEDEGPAQICARIANGSIANDFDNTLRAAVQTLAASDAIPVNMKATVGVDFGVSTEDLTYRPGAGTGDETCTGITIFHDNEVELNESFIVTMSTANPNQLVQDDNQITVVIIDVEKPSITVSTSATPSPQPQCPDCKEDLAIGITFLITFLLTCLFAVVIIVLIVLWDRKDKQKTSKEKSQYDKQLTRDPSPVVANGNSEADVEDIDVEVEVEQIEQSTGL